MFCVQKDAVIKCFKSIPVGGVELCYTKCVCIDWISNACLYATQPTWAAFPAVAV